jgi:hypothetical protein
LGNDPPRLVRVRVVANGDESGSLVPSCSLDIYRYNMLKLWALFSFSLVQQWPR